MGAIDLILGDLLINAATTRVEVRYGTPIRGIIRLNLRARDELRQFEAHVEAMAIAPLVVFHHRMV